jgi:hypothetical protein
MRDIIEEFKAVDLFSIGVFAKFDVFTLERNCEID